MPSSYRSVWLHVVFSTKYRSWLILPSIEKKIYDHMFKELTKCGCNVAIINGMPDHVHLFYLQNPQKPITDVIRQVKGSTSHWINEQKMISGQFAWQKGFAVFSVSEGHKNRVIQYIRDQKEHHQMNTIVQEFETIEEEGIVNDE